MTERTAPALASSSWHIRPAGLPDLEAVAEIYNQSIRARDSTMDLGELRAEHFRDIIGGMNDRESLLVLEAGGKPIAWGILKRYSDRPGYSIACETSVYVDRSHAGRRTGTGSVLQAELIRRAELAGYHHIVAKIWAENEISIGMHLKHGFERVGVQQEIGLVDGRMVDVLIMQRVL
jgi:phosphinothricin acetyltransferase